MICRGRALGLAGSFVALLLWVPSVAAIATTGEFSVSGSVHYPSGATLELSPIVVLDNDTATIGNFEISAPSMRVTVIENHYYGLPGSVILRSDQTERTWSQTNAVLRRLADGDHEGFLGIRSGHAASLSATLNAPTDLDARIESTVSTVGEATRDREGVSWFYHKQDGSHLYLNGRLDLQHVGALGAKINGLDFELTASENSTPVEWRTGRVEISAAEVVIRWFWIEAEEATVKFSSGNAPVEVLASDAPSVLWNGDARLTPVQGGLDTLDGAYLPTGKQAILSGTFSASQSPGEKAGESRLTNLHGEMASTTLAYKPSVLAPLSPLRSSWWGPVFVAGLAAVVAGGGTGLVMWRRKARVPISAEDCADYASIAIAERDYPTGLKWAQRGRRLSPRSARLAADEAVCLAETGDVDGALTAYAQAHDLAPHGEFALEAARLMRVERRSPDGVENLLLAALQKSPDLRGDIETEFPEIVSRTRWAAETQHLRRQTP